MITKQHSHYLKFLAQGYNILLISNRSVKEYDEVKDYFDLGCQRNQTQVELDNLTFTLMNNNIDIVLFDFTDDNDLAQNFYDAILNYNKRIIVIGIVKDNKDSFSLVKKLDHFLIETFTKEELKDKILTTLSVYYTVKSVSMRDIKIQTGSSEISNELDEFFDMYEGSSLFIVDELVELNNALKSGELSLELLSTISSKISEIAVIFDANEEISIASEIFRELALYLDKLDISTIEPSSLHAFNYLCAIIDDTNKTLMDMFVDRLFKDVYIFKDSLKNNINFLEDALSANKEEDESELEFF